MNKHVSGRQLGAIMALKHVSKKTIGKQIGVTTQAVCNWISSDKRIKPEFIEGITECLEMTPEEFWGWIDRIGERGGRW